MWPWPHRYYIVRYGCIYLCVHSCNLLKLTGDIYSVEQRKLGSCDPSLEPTDFRSRVST